MKYRTLGSTGLRVSVVGIGTWQFGGEWGKDFSQDEVNQMFDACRQTGINLIDTAECYGDHLSESLIGKAIERDRDKWVVATKIGHKFHGYMDRTDERKPADAMKQLEDSLKALRTDHVDVLQYHSIRDSEFDNPELQAAMIKLKQQGKVRHIGNSISPNNNVHQTDGSTKAQVEVIQVIYNRIDRVPEQGVFQACTRQNLGVLARVPLASGFLSGKYKPGTKFKEGDVRSSRDDAQIQEKLKEVEQIRKSELPPGVNMATWALAWCLQHPAVTSVIPGCKNVEQVKTNAAAGDLDLVRSDHPQAVK